MSNLFTSLLVLIFFFARSICNEYCIVHPDHNLCVLPPLSDDCEKFRENMPNDTQQVKILDWHNRLRQKVALGFEKRSFRGGPQPAATNMMKMDWDPELARIAQRVANQCRFQYSCKKCNTVLGGRFAVGESLALVRYYNYQPESFDFVDIIKGWYEDEVENMYPSFVDAYVHSTSWDHYTTIVWWNTRSIGCGGSSYVKEGVIHQLVVCEYGAAANLPMARVYERGHPCSNCPLDTECDLDYYGLCSITRDPFNVLEAFTHTDQEYLGLAPSGHIDLK